MLQAMRSGDKRFLDYLFRHGYDIEGEDYHNIKCGSISSMKYLHERGIPFSHYSGHCVMTDLMAGGVLSRGLIYICEHGYAMTENLFTSAVLMNNMPTIKFLYANGCPYNKKALLVRQCNRDIKAFIESLP
jgi:hypothetical protein